MERNDFDDFECHFSVGSCEYGNNIGYEDMRWHFLNSMTENAVSAQKFVYADLVTKINRLSFNAKNFSLSFSFLDKTSRFICMTLCYLCAEKREMERSCELRLALSPCQYYDRVAPRSKKIFE